VITTVRRVHAILTRLARRIVQALTSVVRPWPDLLSAAVDRLRPARHGRLVEHIGATETFGSELRALRSVEVSSELVSDIETELQWGLTWYEFERTMQAEIDRIFAPYLPEPGCGSFDELREQVGLEAGTA
jgi:hypothetical protein